MSFGGKSSDNMPETFSGLPIKFDWNIRVHDRGLSRV
jgi:hypothetical protein